MKDKEIPAWTQCGCCEEFYCAIHQEHVHDCECPGIDTWADAGRWPYDDPVTDTLRTWVAANPFNYND